MNGRIVGTKPLYVALAQRKEVYREWPACVGMQQMGQIFQPGGAGGYFVLTIPPAQRFYGPAQMTQIRPSPRWTAQPPVRPSTQTAGSGYPNMQAPFRPAPRAPIQAAIRTSLGARPITGQQGVATAASIRAPLVTQSGRPAGYKYTANMRNPPASQPVYISKVKSH